MAIDRPRLRMAPAPSGFLHLGNVRTFLFDYLYARSHGGDLVLRIEDTDAARSTAEAEHYIQDALRWLGIDWDEGPDIGGPHGPYRQSERVNLHQEAATAMLSAGQAYECFCTPEELDAERAEQQARGQAPRYSGRCYLWTDADRDAARRRGLIPAIRFHVPPSQEISWDDMVYGHISFQSDDIGDFIILRPNGSPIYNLANVVDDHGMNITVGLRSQSHLSNTPRQIVLYQALGWEPPQFAHVPDVSDLQGRKMGKRYGAKGVTEYRAEGYLPEAMANYMALLGWSSPSNEEFLSMADLRHQFKFDRVQRSNAAFDPERLEWFNAQYLRRLPTAELVQRFRSYLRTSGSDPVVQDASCEQLGTILPLIRERVRTLAEIPPMVQFFFRDPVLSAEAFRIREYAHHETALGLAAVIEVLQNQEPFTSQAIVEAVTAVAERVGWKRGDLFMAIRIAITGDTISPPLTESMELLGPETSLLRLVRAADVLTTQPAAT